MGGYEPGRLLAGRYRLLTVIGQGGMGAVWRARDELLKRDVAVKEIIWPPQMDPEERETARQRAVREAQMAARLRHPNVVGVYDFFEEDGRPCLVMELVPYRSLRDAIAAEGPLSPGQAARVGLGVLAALAATHEAGVLHRDVKPANILLSPDGRVILTDFGIAKAADSPTLTRSGVLIGSPSYIAPERARGGQASAAADLWALGASLYAAVEGRPPFDRDGVLASLTAVVADDPDPPSHAGPLWPVISGLLRKDPEARLNAAEAGQLLSRIADKDTAVPGGLAASRNGSQRIEGPGQDVLATTDSITTVESDQAMTHRQATTSGTAAMSEPAVPETATAEPAVVEPAATESAVAEPAVAEPAVAEPAVAEPAVAEPAVAGAAVAGAAVAEPAAAEPAVAARASSATAPDAGHGPDLLAPQARSKGRRYRSVYAAAGVLAVALIAGVTLVLARSPGRQLAPHPAAKTPAAASTPKAAPSPATSSSATPGSSSSATPGSSSSATPGSSSSATPGSSGSSALPAGYYRYTSPTGFSIGVPAGWQISYVGQLVYFRDPKDSAIFLFIQQSDDPQPNPLADWQQQAANRASSYPDYHLIRLQAVVYAQAEKAADWEFTYDSDGVPVQVLNRNVLANARHAYALYWSTPVSDWTAYYHYFQAFAATFRPASVDQAG